MDKQDIAHRDWASRLKPVKQKASRPRFSFSFTVDWDKRNKEKNEKRQKAKWGWARKKKKRMVWNNEESTQAKMNKIAPLDEYPLQHSRHR